jgi:hypothetical protein
MYGSESSIFTLRSKLKSNGCITKLLFCDVPNADSVESSIFLRLVWFPSQGVLSVPGSEAGSNLFTYLPLMNFLFRKVEVSIITGIFPLESFESRLKVLLLPYYLCTVHLYQIRYFVILLLDLVFV